MTHDIDKHKYFIGRLLQKNDSYRRGDFEVIGMFVSYRVPIIVKSKGGLHSITPESLLCKNTTPAICNAVDKTEYWKGMAIQKHGDTYDYSKTVYSKADFPILIGCPVHGDFIIAATKHLAGAGCQLCSHESRLGSRRDREEFIEKSQRIHGYKYTYDNTILKPGHQLITITCSEHGDFRQSITNHLYGYEGCRKCATNKRAVNCGSWSGEAWTSTAELSNRFDSFKVYIIECTGNGECFYKVGRTYTKLHFRFSGKKIPYEYFPIKILHFNSAKEAIAAEAMCKRANKQFRYDPKLDFKGNKECFTQIIIPDDETFATISTI